MENGGYIARQSTKSIAAGDQGEKSEGENGICLPDRNPYLNQQAIQLMANRHQQANRRFPSHMPAVPASSAEKGIIQKVSDDNQVIQMVNQIPRPNFSKKVQETIRLRGGEHRRHVVMSSRIREAVWAYHMESDAAQKEPRRLELQQAIGSDSSLRNEMREVIELTHNSMGNLFAGRGSENSAIGFSVNPLYHIARSIDPSGLNTIQKITEAVISWKKNRIFGFAQPFKEQIADQLLEWLNEPSNHNGDMEEIGKAIQDFAFSCSFDMAYIEDEEGNHDFPPHIDRQIQATLLDIATVLERVIDSPQAEHPDFYRGLAYLISIKDNF